MTAEQLPIRFQEHVQSLGINAASIGFATLTMESDRYVCIRERVGEQAQVVIVGLQDASNVLRRPITADSAIMNPDLPVIALKAGKQIQLFDLEKRQRIKTHVMADEIVFWKWLGPSTIGIITETAAYHWSLEAGDDEGPHRVFDRHASLAGAQVINYRTDSAGKWLLLVGITAQAGRVIGAMQLFNVDRGVSQPIEGHAGAFAEFRMDGAPHPTKVFSFAVRTAAGAGKLHIVEIDHREGNPPFPKRAVDLFFPSEAANDFPVAMQVSAKYDVVYVVTKYGFIHVYDLETGACIFMNRISTDTIFVTAEHRSTGGIVGVNRRGQVLSVTIDEQAVVPHILATANNTELAIRIASKCNLPGADDLFVARFNELMAAGNYTEAAKVAAKSPQGVLRTGATIQRFKALPAPAPGQMTPILQYFGVLLESGQLNREESMELTRPVLQQGKKQLLEKWLKENKLECSEELGDLVRQFDLTLALSVYLRADVPEKVCACFAESGQFSKIVLFGKKVGYTPDYERLLEAALDVDPAKAVEFAQQLIADDCISLETVFDAFASRNYVQQATACLLEPLKADQPEQGRLQTRLLELNLRHAPRVADAILANRLFSHFDRPSTARLCETARLHQRALELYTAPEDIQRVLGEADNIDADWLVRYLEPLPAASMLALMQHLLDQNVRQHLQLVVQAATRYSAKLSPRAIIALFEGVQSFEGLYHYLGSVVHASTDADVHFGYIQAACRTGQMKEVERMCRESKHYDPEAVKNFLKEAKLADQLPLIIVCDRHDFVQELVLYLHQNGLHRFIELYVQRVNPARTPAVIAALLDVGGEAGQIQGLLQTVTGSFSLDELTAECELRGQLRILQPFLEHKQRVQPELRSDSALNTALAKIYIDTNARAAEDYLRSPEACYDPASVGRYCERRDPQLAIIAYRRGQCDDDLLRVTNANALYKQQAAYLIRRRDPAVWARVLGPTNEHRDKLVKQIVVSSLPECRDGEDVSSTVKAFIAADLKADLIALLERLLFDGGAAASFRGNRNLHNLLLLTAISTAPERVQEFVDQLDNFDAPEVASVALQHGLYEEAFTLYRRANMHVEAIGVLVEHVGSIERAREYAEKMGRKDVWAALGRAQRARQLFHDAVDSFIRADDPSDHGEMIAAGRSAGAWDDLLRYLQMARNRLRDATIESELLYVLARLDQLQQLTAIVSAPNIAHVQAVGERCQAEGLYEAARILFSSISNFARLAATLVHLQDYTGAVDCARKANSVRVWRDVLEACLEMKEFRLAQMCALNLVIHAEELEGLIRVYEQLGYFEQCMQLLEAGLALDRAHMGMFTELAILYSRHRPAKLMEHLGLYWSRLSISRVIAACEAANLWSEQVFLHFHNEEYDRAVQVMLEHAGVALDHDRLGKALLKCTNTDTLYSALRYYATQHPKRVNDLLALLASRVDPIKIVGLFERMALLSLAKGYLVSVQSMHSPVINQALNEVLLEEEDVEGLQLSISRSDRFDTDVLAKRLASHVLPQFRRLAAHIYKQARRWEDAIAILKADALYSEALALAAESKSRACAEGILRYFGELKNETMFAACLVTAYGLIRIDVAMEVGHRNGWQTSLLPFLCQAMREYQEKVDRLERDVESLRSAAAANSTVAANNGGLVGAMGNLMIAGASSNGSGHHVNAPQQRDREAGYGAYVYK